MKNNNEYKATQKFLLESPRKVRLVVGVVKKMKPVEAVEKLPFVQKRAAVAVSKVIRSAIANAKFAGVSDTDLIFKEIQIGEGPRLKRGRAASRGMWHPIKKRMCHIRVILSTVKKEEDSVEKEAKSATVVEGKEVKKIETKSAKKTVKKEAKK